jgi:transcriptional regulator GlxA family with amidase domain
MFDRSLRGILFSQESTKAIIPRLVQLPYKHGFDSVLELMSILHDLSTSRNYQLLSDVTFSNVETQSYNSRRIKNIMDYLKSNFDKNVSLTEASKIAGMTDVAFSRFFKLRTGKTFIDTLNELKLGHASRLLIDTTRSVNEVAYCCGFNNMSNFNRIFKKKKHCTPKEYRESFTSSAGLRTFV